MPPIPQLAVPPEVLSSGWEDADLAAATAADGSAAALPAADQSFWQGFGNPVLADQVARASHANPGIAAAAARIRQAQGQLAIAGAALRPSLSAAATLDGRVAAQGGLPGLSSIPASLGLDLTYDPDLAGGSRASRRAAAARLDAAGWDADDVALVVRAETARATVQWATLGDRLRLADRDVARARELVRILRVRRREGVLSAVDSGIGEVELGRLQADRSVLAEAQARTASALAVLSGAEATGFTPPDVTVTSLSVPPIDPGQPAELALRRPDLRAAEARIRAAHGDIAAARAAFLPSVRLTAGAIVEALVGDPLGATLRAGGNALTPIFQGGRLRGGLELAEGQQQEAVALYRGSLLRALGEGRSALDGIAEADRRIAVLSESLAPAREASRLARLQYLEGFVDITTVLEAERSESAIEGDLLVARQDRLLAAIDLYRALGGAPLPAPGFSVASRLDQRPPWP